jgi:hypothetical protein
LTAGQVSRVNVDYIEFCYYYKGVRKYGKDFSAIAEVIGTKTEAHVRSFFVNFRRRYNLDEVLAEYEAEHGLESSKAKIENDVEVVRF